ncbi:MAG: MFS transporter [Candidatus Rokubacteria bacterium]|nr:MFS transporter [Candidatus Rokubacteria bacterium]
MRRSALRKDTLWLAGICAARLGASSPYLAYAAVLPLLQVEWAMSATAAGSISSAFQLGYAASLVVLSALADRVGARRIFLWSTAATAATTALIPLLARSYSSGLVLFTLVALVNGGTYTPGLMLLAERFPPERRGNAIGWFLAAASLGYAVSLAVTGLLVRVAGWRGAFWVLTLGPVMATLVSAWALRGTREGAVGSGIGGLSLAEGFFKNRAALLMMTGYTFHSWEVLGMWAWTPAYLAAALALQGRELVRATGLGATLTAVFHVMGLVATGAGGWLSDRWGRTAVILAMLTISGLCSFTFGWLVSAPLVVILAVGVIYAFSAIGDSPVFSTGFTEVVDGRILGSALAVRSLAGFGAGALASLTFGGILDLTNPAGSAPRYPVWGWAFSVLGFGAVFGLASTAWLRALPESRRMAAGKR